MTEPVRWTASFDVTWAPMLTYGYRRLSLLEWYEKNLDVVQFHESDHIGIAVGSPALRLVVSETGLSLLLRSPIAKPDALLEAISGTFEILEPREPHGGSYKALWSSEVEGADYDTTRREFATRAIGAIDPSVGSAIDCAVLFDADVLGGHAQIDFGIVSADELRMRLTNPDLSRVATISGLGNPVASGLPSELPSVSLLADLVWHSHDERADAVATASDVVGLVNRVEIGFGGLVSALRAAL